MTSSILLFKIGGSIGAASVVAGGSYVAYQNSDSIKKFFRTQQQEPAIPTNKVVTPVETNLFLVRYKGDAPQTAAAIPTETSLTCDFASISGTGCKIYKFAADKTENNFTTTEILGLTASSSTSEFKTNNYFVIELTDLKKTATDLQNQIFTIKNGETIQGKFDFDQIIIGEAKKSGNPDTPSEETYTVKRAATWANATDLTSYGCKLSTTSKLDNYDFSCKLVKISPIATNTITPFEKVKELTEKLASTSLSASTDDYYKLIVNNKLLYNLAFAENTETKVEIDLIKNDGTSLGKLELKQKLVGDKFIGKTDLLLAKAKTATTETTTALTDATCSFTSTTPVVEADKIACTLYKASPLNQTPVTQLTLGTSAIEPTETFIEHTYYTIKLTKEKEISAFDGKTEIFYHIPVPADSGAAATHKTVSLSIAALMSGDTTNSNKPFFITEPKTTQEQ